MERGERRERKDEIGERREERRERRGEEKREEERRGEERRERGEKRGEDATSSFLASGRAQIIIITLAVDHNYIYNFGGRPITITIIVISTGAEKDERDS